MKELKAWRLTLENKENGRRTCIYRVYEKENEVKEYFDKNWNRFQHLVKIEDISHTKKGQKLIEAETRFNCFGKPVTKTM